VRIADGDVEEKGEWRFRSRSASDTRTGSGVGTLKAWLDGGGMDVWLKCGRADCGATGCAFSNLMGGSDIREAMEG
jgi:hypothetical protein